MKQSIAIYKHAFSIDANLYYLFCWAIIATAVCVLLPRLLIFIQEIYKIHKQNTEILKDEKQQLKKARDSYTKKTEALNNDLSYKQKQEDILKYLIKKDESGSKDYYASLANLYELNITNSKQEK